MFNLKWNHESQASSFAAKFWTFYGVIARCMIYECWPWKTRGLFVFYNNELEAKSVQNSERAWQLVRSLFLAWSRRVLRKFRPKYRN